MLLNSNLITCNHQVWKTTWRPCLGVTCTVTLERCDHWSPHRQLELDIGPVRTVSSCHVRLGDISLKYFYWSNLWQWPGIIVMSDIDLKGDTRVTSWWGLSLSPGHQTQPIIPAKIFIKTTIESTLPSKKQWGIILH